MGRNENGREGKSASVNGRPLCADLNDWEFRSLTRFVVVRNGKLANKNAATAQGVGKSSLYLPREAC